MNAETRGQKQKATTSTHTSSAASDTDADIAYKSFRHFAELKSFNSNDVLVLSATIFFLKSNNRTNEI